MPAAAKDFAPSGCTDSVESSLATGELPGTDRQAFAVRYSAAPDPNVPGTRCSGASTGPTATASSSGSGSKVPSMHHSEAIGFADRDQRPVGIYVDGQLSASGIDRTAPRGAAGPSWPGEAARTLAVTVFACSPAGATASRSGRRGARAVGDLDPGRPSATRVLVGRRARVDPAHRRQESRGPMPTARRASGRRRRAPLGEPTGQALGALGPGQFRSGTGTGRPGCSPPRASR